MADDSKLRFSRATPAYPSTASTAAAASARSATADPLVELARLIGQNENSFGAARYDSDAGAPGRPIPASERLEAASRQLARSINSRATRDATAFDPRRAAMASAAPSTVPEPEYVYSHATPTPPAQRGTADSAQQYGYDPRYAEAPEYEPQAAYGDEYYEEQEGDYPYADEDLGPLPPERRRGGLMTIAAVLGLAAVGTVGAFGYWAVTGTHSGPPPIIKADTTPAKIVPPQKNDGQPNKVASERGGEKGQVERIVTREEQPIEMREPRHSAPRMVTSSAGGAPVPGSRTQAGAPVLPGATGTIPSVGPTEPKKVRTVAIRPDGSVVPDSARTASTEPVPPRQPAPAVPVARPGSGSARTAAAGPAPIALGPQTLGPQTTGTTTASAAPAPQAATAGTHVVQLASQRSEEEARASFRALQERYPNILGGWQPLIRRVDLGSRGTYYRAQVGPFASIEQANAFCGNLKAAGGQCIVQRN